MHIEVMESWLVSIILITIRLSVLFFSTPLDIFGKVPAKIKLFCCLSISIILASGLPTAHYPQQLNLTFLAIASINELLIGSIMAFGLHCAFGAMSIGGGLIDMQAGFGAANVLNPATNSYEPIFGAILTLLLTAIFFASGAFAQLLRGLMFSLEHTPPGEPLSHLSLRSIITQFGLMFSYGLVLASPIIASLLLVDTSIGVMSRSMPQMNVYFLFLPLKIGLSLILIAISLRYVNPLMEQVLLSVFRFWEQSL